MSIFIQIVATLFLMPMGLFLLDAAPSSWLAVSRAAMVLFVVIAIWYRP